MTTLPPLPLTHGAFVIDASTLEGRFMSCPREYEYYGLRKREKADFPAGREFGKFVHDHLLAPHYRGEHVDIETALQSFPAELEQDYRNAGYAKVLWKMYCDNYQAEPFDVVKGADGKPAVELSFAVPVCSVPASWDMVPVVWSGRIDLITQWPHDSGPTPLDHKTKSVGGESAWDDYANSTQQIGYVWALQKLLGVPIDSFCINLILTRKLTSTGKGIEFARQRFPVSPEIVAEFPQRIEEVVRSLFDMHMRGYFPMHTSSCTRKYGKCEYLEVCKSIPSLREEMLSTGLYKDVTWSPLI